jgi:hypothetical protein
MDDLGADRAISGADRAISGGFVIASSPVQPGRGNWSAKTVRTFLTQPVLTSSAETRTAQPANRKPYRAFELQGWIL